MEKSRVDYPGKQKLGLPEGVIEKTLQSLFAAQAQWEALVNTSFLASPAKSDYLKILADRFRRLA